MGPFSKKTAPVEAEGKNTPAQSTPANRSDASLPAQIENHTTAGPRSGEIEEGKATGIAVLLGAIASLGGLMFGYESGQISGKN